MDLTRVGSLCMDEASIQSQAGGAIEVFGEKEFRVEIGHIGRGGVSNVWTWLALRSACGSPYKGVLTSASVCAGL